MFSHLSCINFSLQYFVSLYSSKICLTPSFSKHNGHLPLSAFLLTALSCHIPAISHAIPLSFLEQHSMYNFLPYTISVLCIVSMSFHLEILLTYFVSQYHYISLSLTLTFISNYILVDSSTQKSIRYCG
jgi:hypothetical protein